MGWKAKANLKGPQGSRGDRGLQGLPGINVVPAVTAVAEYIGGPGENAAKTAVQNVVVAAQVGPGALRGNRIAVLSDSTARGTYFGDSDAGTAGGSVLIHGMSWLSWMAQSSGGRLVRHRNAAVIGNTLEMMDARVAGEVIAYRPDACIVVSGYNDIMGDVSLERYMTALRSIHAKLRAAGVEMIAATPLSTFNGGAPFLARLDELAAAVRAYAAREKLQLLDFSLLRDGTGAMLPYIKTDGDGVHPGAAGQMWLGKWVRDQLLPRLPRSQSMPLALTLNDRGNIAPNRLFTGTVAANGLAPSVSSGQTGNSKVTYSVTANTGAKLGNAQRVTVATTTEEAFIYQRIPTGAGLTPGDRVAITGKITVQGVQGFIRPEFNTPPYNAMAARITADVTDATYYAEFVVPTNLGPYFEVRIIAGASQTWRGLEIEPWVPGSGYVEVSEFTVYNLSKLGIA